MASAAYAVSYSLSMPCWKTQSLPDFLIDQIRRELLGNQIKWQKRHHHEAVLLLTEPIMQGNVNCFGTTNRRNPVVVEAFQ